MRVIRNILLHIFIFLRRNKRLARMVYFCVPDIPVKIKIPQIGLLRIRLRRNKLLWLRSPLAMEWYPLAALKAFVRPSDVVWDVGANIGMYSRWLVSHLKAGRVYAFEPMVSNLPELSANLELGGITGQVSVLPWALSDVNGQVEFQADEVQGVSGSVNAICGDKPSEAHASMGIPPKVEVVISRTVDSILAEGVVPVPDVMKVDVEGAEFLLLQGAANLLRSHSPRLVIETHGLEVAKKCLHLLFSHGYSVAVCVQPHIEPNRHQRLNEKMVDKIADKYDAYFIMASKLATDIPDTLDYANL